MHVFDTPTVVLNIMFLFFFDQLNNNVERQVWLIINLRCLNTCLNVCES